MNMNFGVILTGIYFEMIYEIFDLGTVKYIRFILVWRSFWKDFDDRGHIEIEWKLNFFRDFNLLEVLKYIQLLKLIENEQFEI